MILRYLLFVLSIAQASYVIAMENDQSQEKRLVLTSICSSLAAQRVQRAPKKALAKASANIRVVGVKTTDNFKIMVLKEFIEESGLLMKSLTGVDEELITWAGVTRANFSIVLKCLKLAASVTRPRRELAQNNYAEKQQELEYNFSNAQKDLTLILATCTRKQWKKCFKTASVFRIETIKQAAQTIGKDKGWLNKVAAADDTQEIN
ncbi:MAG: hypothetical protein AB7F19_03395 [Candidatus Babeliales bacterium]